MPRTVNFVPIRLKKSPIIKPLKGGQLVIFYTVVLLTPGITAPWFWPFCTLSTCSTLDDDDDDDDGDDVRLFCFTFL